MVRICAVNIAELREADLAACKTVLSEDRRIKAERFRFEKDRVRCILGEALVRYVMETECGIAQKTISFTADPNGRPFAIFPEDKAFDFNISHAGDWVICSIGNERSGIDIEKVFVIDHRLAESVLTPNELASLNKLPPHEQNKLFCQLWTLKESYSKQIGMGLGISFRELEMKKHEALIWHAVGDLKRVIFTRFWADDYAISLCVPLSAEVSLKITTLNADAIESFFLSHHYHR